MRKLIITILLVLVFVLPVFASEPVLIDVDTSRTSITAEDTEGFKSVILGLIGPYETVITDYTYEDENSNIFHAVTVERDFTWIWSCILFIVVVYCVFRVIGGLICR